MKSGFSLNLLNFPSGWWQKKGVDIFTMIKGDADKGIMQDGQQNIQYRSEEYKKYKANYMKRFTKDTKGGRRALTKKGKPYANYKHVKGVAGIQANNNETKFVNMQLTGALFRTLQSNIKAWTNNLGVTLGYGEDRSNAGKIYGAEDNGRQIVGLREENIEQVFQDAIKIIDKNILEQWPDDIKIIIS